MWPVFFAVIGITEHSADFSPAVFITLRQVFPVCTYLSGVLMSKFIQNRIFKLSIEKQVSLKNDFLSGLTVALALVPEAIAFAFVARIDPIIGLYAAFMMGVGTAIFGGRPGMISGATGAVAVIFAPMVVQQTARVGMQGALSYLFVAVVLMGLIQVAVGVLKLGKFIRLVPHPVMLGFVNGLALIILKSQLEMFYTLKDGHHVLLGGIPLLVMLLLTGLTMLISHFLPRLTRAVPATLTGIVVVSLLSLLLEKSGIHVRTVLDFVQTLDPGKTTLAASLPSFAVPDGLFSWETLRTVFPFSLIAASVGLIESLMTLMLVDEVTETRGKSNRECIGQGISNIVNGFFGGMGGCAMIGQSMINVRAGGRTRFSQFVAGLSLMLFVLWGARLIESIPLAALVGVMFLVVIGTFEWATFRIIHQIPKSDALVIIIVTVITILENLAVAVLAGLIVSALVFAWKKSTNIMVTVSNDEAGFKVYRLEGALFFGSANLFKRLFNFQDDPKDVIIDFAGATVYDHSAIEALNFVTEKYAEYNTNLHLLNLSEECTQVLTKANNVVELSIVENIDCWHLADNCLE